MLLGRQEPTLRIAPEYGMTHGEKADKLLRLADVELMPWQRSLLDDWLSFYPDGSWAATSCGLSVPRQNGKTHLIAARIAFGMVAFSEWCVYTSHLQKTSTETFETLRAIFEAPALAKYVKDIKSALGREEILLTNGARCKFLARTRNGGRGQHGDLLCFDEAAEVSSEMQASFLPLLAASKRPQTLYCGTPPDENAPGDVFSRIRDNAIDGSTSKTAWAEWSTDEVGDISEERRWAECNPSYGYRIQPQTIVSEYEQMKGSDERFARERLGWWNPGGVAAVIPRERWSACATEEPPEDGIKCFAVKFSPDGETVSVVVAVRPRESGKPHFELVEHADTDGGVAWLSDALARKKSDTAQYIVDGLGSAENLRDSMVRRGVSKSLIKIPKPAEVASANSALLDAIRSESVTYYQDEEMDAAARGCSKRKIGTNGGWGFRSEDGADASILEAAALALWGASSTRRDPKRKARMAW